LALEKLAEVRALLAARLVAEMKARVAPGAGAQPRLQQEEKLERKSNSARRKE